MGCFPSSSRGPLRRGAGFRPHRLIGRKCLVSSPPATHAVYQLTFELHEDEPWPFKYSQPTTHIKIRLPGAFLRARTYSLASDSAGRIVTGDAVELQHLNFVATDDTAPDSDSTPASSPKRTFSIMVKHYPGGTSSTFVTQTLKIGECADICLTRTKGIRSLPALSLPPSSSPSPSYPHHLALVLFGVGVVEAFQTIPRYLQRNFAVTVILANAVAADVLLPEWWKYMRAKYSPAQLRFVHIWSREKSAVAAAAESSSSSSPASSSPPIEWSDIGEVIRGVRLTGPLLRDIFKGNVAAQPPAIIPHHDEADDGDKHSNGQVANGKSSSLAFITPQAYVVIGSKASIRSTWQLLKRDVDRQTRNFLTFSLAGCFCCCTATPDDAED